MKNRLITGIPRSGTTLLASLVAESGDTVVFSEPEWLQKIRSISKDSKEFSQNLLLHISKLRNDISKKKPIKLKNNPKTNKLPTNYYLRTNVNEIVTNKQEHFFKLGKESASKTFYIKSNAQFTSCLTDIIRVSQVDKIYCIIRNPISCLMSWRSLNIPVSQGNMKIAEKYSNSYRKSILNSNNLLHKQILMIDWFYKEYLKNSANITIIKYEDIIENTSEVYKQITGFKLLSENKLVSQNKNKYYNYAEKKRIKEYLVRFGTFYQNFYPDLV